MVEKQCELCGVHFNGGEPCHLPSCSEFKESIARLQVEAEKAQAEFTPGPWHTGHDDRWPLIFGPEGTRRDFVGLIPIARVNGESQEDHANAALLTAAPDLLAALKLALPLLNAFAATESEGDADDEDNLGGEIDAATGAIIAAIAKATGK